MTEELIDKAVSEKYNIVVEGTFRTSSTPVSTPEKDEAGRMQDRNCDSDMRQ